MCEQVYGCVNCGEGEAEALLMPRVLPEFIPEYRLDTIAPEPEPVKVRAETRTARLQFRQDSYRIRPDYKNNRAELDTVSNSSSPVMPRPKAARRITSPCRRTEPKRWLITSAVTMR